MQFAEAVVSAQDVVCIPQAIRLASTVAQRAGHSADRRVVAQNHPAFTGRNVLRRLKTKTCHMPQGAGHMSLPGGPPGLCCVFNDYEIVTPCQGHDGFHVCWPPAEMHRQERPGAGCDTCLGADWIKSIRMWIDIGKDRYSTNFQRGCSRRDKRIARHDDFVP